jgi:hypothetical protein
MGRGWHMTPEQRERASEAAKLRLDWRLGLRTDFIEPIKVADIRETGLSAVVAQLDRQVRFLLAVQRELAPVLRLGEVWIQGLQVSLQRDCDRHAHAAWGRARREGITTPISPWWLWHALAAVLDRVEQAAPEGGVHLGIPLGGP